PYNHHMPETNTEVIEASQEEEADPRGNDSAEVRRERETPGRAWDLPEAMFPGETRKLLHGRPFDPMAVRAAIIPVEEFRMEELLPLARPGQYRFRPFSGEEPEEHEDDRFRVRGGQDQPAARFQDSPDLLDEALRMAQVLVHFGGHHAIDGSGSEREARIRGGGEVIHAVGGLGRLAQAASLHVDAHRESISRQVREASRRDPGSRTHFDEDRVRSVQEG